MTVRLAGLELVYLVNFTTVPPSMVKLVTFTGEVTKNVWSAASVSWLVLKLSVL